MFALTASYLVNVWLITRKLGRVQGYHKTCSDCSLSLLLTSNLSVLLLNTVRVLQTAASTVHRKFEKSIAIIHKDQQLLDRKLCYTFN